VTNGQLAKYRFSPVCSVLVEKKMAGDKVSVTFEINPDAQQMLQTITDKYGLPDNSKTLRCLLDFVAEKEANWDKIFKKIRCIRC
tara:strand:+ start:194 stop:448 length:255 start_codon:yes stop_codon:yes gene_type:complete